MKLNKVAGATSEIWQVFIRDSTSTVGAGLTGLTNASSGLTAYYHRDTDTTATVITLVTMTVGTYTSSGFKEIDAANMPGWYQFCPPNAAIAAGAKSCGFHLKGATSMVPLPIEVQLVAVNPDSATSFITGVNALAPPTNWNLEVIDASGRMDVGKINGVSTSLVTTVKAVQGLTTADTIATYTGNTVQTGDAYARLGAPAGASVSADVAAAKADTAAIKTKTDSLTFTITNQIDSNVIDWKSATAPAMTGDAFARLGAPAGASVSADVAAINAKTTNLPAAPASTTNITAGTITTVTNLTNAPTAGDFTATMKAATLARVTLVDTATTLTNAPSDSSGVTTLLSRLSALRAGYLDLLNSYLDSAVSAVKTVVDAIKAKTDNLPASPAAVGSAMVLTTGERNSVADALLDRTGAIETGLTVRQTLRLSAAADAGKTSGMATTTAVVRDLADTKDRISATVDSNGNRTAVTRDLT